jgi:hypothetical protein
MMFKPPSANDDQFLEILAFQGRFQSIKNGTESGRCQIWLATSMHHNDLYELPAERVL